MGLKRFNNTTNQPYHIDKIVGKSKAGKMINDGTIEIGVLNFYEVNLENCYVILDGEKNLN